MYLTSGDLVCNRPSKEDKKQDKKQTKEAFNQNCATSEFAQVPTGGTMFDTETGFSRMYPGQYMRNGDFTMQYTCNGNITLTNVWGYQYWSANISAQYPAYLMMQTDGNLVAYKYNSEVANDNNRSAYWATNTGGRTDKPFRMGLLTEGAFIVVNRDNQIIWSVGWNAPASLFPRYGVAVTEQFFNKYIAVRFISSGAYISGFGGYASGYGGTAGSYSRAPAPPGPGWIQVIDAGDRSAKLKVGNNWLTVNRNSWGDINIVPIDRNDRFRIYRNGSNYYLNTVTFLNGMGFVNGSTSCWHTYSYDYTSYDSFRAFTIEGIFPVS